MIKTTREQCVALKRVFDRGPILPMVTEEEVASGITAVPITYKQFRRGLKGTFCCDGCVMIAWSGMWLGIEKDGYTHS